MKNGAITLQVKVCYRVAWFLFGTEEWQQDYQACSCIFAICHLQVIFVEEEGGNMGSQNSELEGLAAYKTFFFSLRKSLLTQRLE